MTDLIDLSAFRSLLSQLGGDARAQHRFVTDFVGLWDARAERLTVALSRPDLEDAHIVLIGIRSSCAMVGAVGLRGVADQMHSALRSGDLQSCTAELDHLLQCGAATCTELTHVIAPAS